MINVNCSRQFCDECNKLKNSWKLRGKKYYKPKYSEKEYRDNFFQCLQKGNFVLTPVGFSQISNIKTYGYKNYFKISWIKILEMYDKLNDLYKYIQKEYLSDDYKSLHDFCKNHKYINNDLIYSLDQQIIKELIPVNIAKYSKSDLKNNFLRIVMTLNKVPSFNEFVENTRIPENTYANVYGLKGKIYDNIVRMYVSDEEFKEYLRQKQIHKSNLMKENSKKNKNIISLEKLESEFKRVFDKCFNDTGVYPSKHLFNNLSIHSDKTYRTKLNMNWTNVCKIYGYPTQQKTSIFETYVLKHLSLILNENYESQKTFPWLIGVNNSPLFCDGYFNKYNLAVEVDGRQHRKPYSKFGGEKVFIIQQANDAIKDKLIPEHGIKLLRIADNTKWYDIEYLRKRLEEVLGTINNYKQ
jgi:hypothetical protein